MSRLPSDSLLDPRQDGTICCPFVQLNNLMLERSNVDATLLRPPLIVWPEEAWASNPFIRTE